MTDDRTVQPPRAPQRSGWLILAGFAVCALGIVGTTVAMLPRGPGKPAMSLIGEPFRLQSSKGGILDTATLEGHPFLVFFGFTRCPNVCPTTLADISNLIDDLNKEGGDITALYVTLDPERDTPEVMREYMTSFSDHIAGLTGTAEEIAEVSRAYRVYAQRVPLQGSDYTMEHTLMVYLMDKRGRFVSKLDLDAGHPFALKQIRSVP